MKKSISGLFLSLILISTLTFADAPVVDYSTDANANRGFTMPSHMRAHAARHPGMPNSTNEARIKKMENQISNLNEQKIPARIEELQQSLQKTNGKVEFQEYQIEQLTKQLKDFYRDLDQRLEGGKSTLKKKPAISNRAMIKNASVVSAAGGILTGSSLSTPPINKGTKDDFFKEQQMYQTAIDLLPEKKHESKSRLRSYLKQYPKGKYASNAHYWLGEINFLQKSYDAAEEEFKIVIDKYARSRRVSDAMFKLALVHKNQGRAVQAKKELNKVIKSYPGTSAARLAKKQLEIS